MKKVLALSGSPHAGGTTEKLLDLFLKNTPPDAQIMRIRAFEECFTPCDGCGACGKSFGCAKPDHAGFFEFLEHSDYIIVATPVYLLSFPAPLKAVFDRFQRYYSARFSLQMRPPIQKSKKAFLILTQGSGNNDGFQTIEKQCGRAFSVMNTVLCGSYLLKNTDQKKPDDLQPEREAIKRAACGFYQNVS